jgi:release factor glutamine methyltransferase
VKRSEVLAKARRLLAYKKIVDATLEGEILLRYGLGISRAQLFAELDSDISQSDVDRVLQLVERRIKGEPSTYITGIKEFYGLDFLVNQCVLIPRPETEILVEQAINLCRNYNYKKVADIGTGCGAIAISLAVNVQDIEVYATDISDEALDVARQNCEKHGVGDRITFLHGNLVEPLPERVDILVANLPYVKEADIPGEGPLSYEPRQALDGGKKGTEKIWDFCWRASAKLKNKGCLLLEIGQGQAAEVKIALMANFLEGSIEIYKDLAGIDRVVKLSLT